MWCAAVLQGVEHRADRQPRHKCYGGTSGAQRAGSRQGVCCTVGSSCSSSGGRGGGRGAGEVLRILKGIGLSDWEGGMLGSCSGGGEEEGEASGGGGGWRAVRFGGYLAGRGA